MIYYLVKNNVVINKALFDAPMPEGWAEPDDLWITDNSEADIGWLYVDGALVAPPPKDE
jgi:hypothetical protein